MITKGELAAMSLRVDEINEILDLCDQDRDYDVICNLENELDRIILTLEKESEHVSN